MGVLDTVARVAMWDQAQRRAAPQQLAAAIEGLGNEFERQRFKKLTGEFIQKGDFSPEGLKSFAEQNRLSLPEMQTVVKLASEFNKYRNEQDPMVQVNTVDENGNTVTKMMRRSQIPAEGIVSERLSPLERLKGKIAGGEKDISTLTLGQRALLDIKPKKPLVLNPGQAVLRNGKWVVPNPKAGKPLVLGPGGALYNLQGQKIAENPKPQEPPKTRRVLRGDTFVDQQWDPKQRKYIDIGKGPRWQKKQEDEFNRNIKKLHEAINLLRERLPEGNLLADFTLDDLDNPENKQTYIQLLKDASKSPDLYIRSAGIRGLKAMENIFGSTDTLTESPPVPGAKKAKDGAWYIKRDNQWYRVDQVQ